MNALNTNEFCVAGFFIVLCMSFYTVNKFCMSSGMKLAMYVNRKDKIM